MSKNRPLNPPSRNLSRSSTDSEPEQPQVRSNKSRKMSRRRRRSGGKSRSAESIEETVPKKLLRNAGECRCCGHCYCRSPGPVDEKYSSATESEFAKRIRENVAMKLTPKKQGYAADPLEDTMFMVRNRDDWSDKPATRSWPGFLIGKTVEYMALAGVVVLISEIVARSGNQNS